MGRRNYGTIFGNGYMGQVNMDRGEHMERAIVPYTCTST